MVGFLHNTSEPSTFEKHPVTCFYGMKDKSQLYEEQIASVNQTTLHQIDGVEVDFSLVQTSLKKEGGKSRSEQSFNTAGNLYMKH
jgi:hypothetical protein